MSVNNTKSPVGPDTPAPSNPRVPAGIGPRLWALHAELSDAEDDLRKAQGTKITASAEVTITYGQHVIAHGDENKKSTKEA